MSKRKFLFSLLFISLIWGCEKENPVEVKQTTPILSNLIAPDTLYTQSPIDHILSIQVIDPQGVEDIALVTLQIFKSDAQTALKIDTLHDEGTNGDIIPGDGIYTGTINSSLASGQPAEFTLIFEAVDKEGHRSATLAHRLSVVAGIENLPPILSNAIAPEFIDIRCSGDYIISVDAADPQGEDIFAVVYEIYKPTALTPALIDTLYDDGSRGDPIAGDGTYATKIQTLFLGAATQVGDYAFRFQAIDYGDKKSNPLLKLVRVVDSGNLPPVIFNPVAPDTIVLASETLTARLTIDVTDPQGLSDIREVFFNSFLPDGRPSSGNPFQMKDDGDINGISGDQAAGDGRYSLTIKVPPETPPGNYTFIFQAIDYSDAESNTITHILTIVK